ncbi:AAA family ATPase [Anabaena sp. FACHB-1250]|uniref:ABC transport protein, ATP-binding subunit n=1 Tax=Dolichospermum planctonicum TaxID=136072 RepID=A0A480A692_9CYAN|nr:MULTISPECIES: AAA family ATPase [Nostocales]MBD2141319.1 AAA family ATPase [Anabaena sp. FACHB-1250]MBD2268172.1 AAA family ATPase [Anabaena sp. FACHB-1391]GCL40369.1 ABC transport protein, ATP-binding subunit [Dolichospermum planctonicum]
MNSFERITIEGYRRLFNVQVDMRDRPLTVMIGANGVGKTSLLEIFSLLAASANAQLANKISELGGLPDIITRDRANSITISLSMSVPGYAPLDYQLEVALKGFTYEIALETLTENNPLVLEPFKHINSLGLDVKYFSTEDQKLLRPNWDHNPLETSLAQVPKMYQEPENLRKRLASCTFYGALNVAPKSPVRLPQSMRPTSLPGANGEDLVSCLYYLRETDPERFEIIEDTLTAAFPDFERLGFPPVAAGTITMTWKDKNFSKPIYMHQLSEGTLRFIWLITLLQSPGLTAVTLIDEPEVSLHPELLRLLADMMREASQKTQLIVATHSDRLIRFLKPEEVLVCDAEDGLTTMRWGDSFNLEHWLEEYSLDQVWAMNLMGGRP